MMAHGETIGLLYVDTGRSRESELLSCRRYYGLSRSGIRSRIFIIDVIWKNRWIGNCPVLIAKRRR
jgi:hypothetical protein